MIGRRGPGWTRRSRSRDTWAPGNLPTGSTRPIDGPPTETRRAVERGLSRGPEFWVTHCPVMVSARRSHMRGSQKIDHLARDRHIDAGSRISGTRSRRASSARTHASILSVLAARGAWDCNPGRPHGRGRMATPSPDGRERRDSRRPSPDTYRKSVQALRRSSRPCSRCGPTLRAHRLASSLGSVELVEDRQKDAEQQRQEDRADDGGDGFSGPWPRRNRP